MTFYYIYSKICKLLNLNYKLDSPHSKTNEEYHFFFIKSNFAFKKKLFFFFGVNHELSLKLARNYSLTANISSIMS